MSLLEGQQITGVWVGGGDQTKTVSEPLGDGEEMLQKKFGDMIIIFWDLRGFEGTLGYKLKKKHKKSPRPWKQTGFSNDTWELILSRFVYNTIA